MFMWYVLTSFINKYLISSHENSQHDKFAIILISPGRLNRRLDFAVDFLGCFCIVRKCCGYKKSLFFSTANSEIWKWLVILNAANLLVYLITPPIVQ